MRVLVPIFSLLLLIAMPLASARADADAPAKPQGLTNVELPPFFAPLIVDGRLQSYAYITVALTPSSPAKVFDIRAKVPNLQDAFLREVNRGTIVKANAKLTDSSAVDTEALKPRLLERMNTILPQGTVTDLKFSEIVIAALGPSP